MSTTAHHDDRIAKMTFSSVYPLYLAKVTRKGRTEEELLTVIEWLTGFDQAKLHKLIAHNVTFQSFFEQATLHPNAHMITGSICGYKIQDIENQLTKQTRYLDKLVDELAQGRKMDKILRKT